MSEITSFPNYINNIIRVLIKHIGSLFSFPNPDQFIQHMYSYLMRFFSTRGIYINGINIRFSNPEELILFFRNNREILPRFMEILDGVAKEVVNDIGREFIDSIEVLYKYYEEDDFEYVKIRVCVKKRQEELMDVWDKIVTELITRHDQRIFISIVNTSLCETDYTQHYRA